MPNPVRAVLTTAWLLAAVPACGALDQLTGRGGSGDDTSPQDEPPAVAPQPRAQPAAQPGAPAPAAIPGLAPAVHVDGSDLKTDDNQAVALHGVNWFGFNTADTQAPHGLWVDDPVGGDFARTVHRMKMLGFNAIRLPFSFAEFPKAPRDFHRTCADVGTQQLAEMTLDPDVHPAAGVHAPELPNPPERESGHCNGYLPSTTTRERYLWAVRFLVHQGFYVLADNHFREDQTAQTDQGAWVRGWAELAQDLHRDESLVGRVFFDLLNEPSQYGELWHKTDKAGVQALYLAAMDEIEKVAPLSIFFIEGTGQDTLGCNWGDGYCTDAQTVTGQGLSDPRPFLTELASKPYHDRVVLAPHVYGPAVTYAPAKFSGPDLFARLSSSFGHLTQDGFQAGQATLKFPVAIGEFGSHFQDPRDVQFMGDFAQYLKNDGPAKDGKHAAIPHWFYWCWNADSGDTGGLVTDNWKDVQWTKIRYLEGLGLTPWYRGNSAGASPQPPPPAPAPTGATGSTPTQGSTTAAPTPPASSGSPATQPSPRAGVSATSSPSPSTKTTPAPSPASTSSRPTTQPSTSAGPSTAQDQLASHPVDLGTPPNLAPIKTQTSQLAPQVSPPVSPRDGAIHAKVSINGWEEGGKHWWAVNLHLINGGQEAIAAPYLIRIQGAKFADLGKIWGVDDLRVVDGAVCGEVKESWATLPPSGRGTTNLGFIYSTADDQKGDWSIEVAGKPAAVNMT